MLLSHAEGTREHAGPTHDFTLFHMISPISDFTMGFAISPSSQMFSESGQRNHCI